MTIIRILIELFFLSLLFNSQTSITIIKDIVISVTAIITVITAIITVIIASKGLETWREQLTGTSKYELAKKILKAVYCVQDELKFLRKEFVPIMGEQLPEVWPTTSGSLVKTENLSNYQDYNNELWDKLDELFQELDDKMMDGKIVWGEDKQELVDQLKALKEKLFEKTNYILFYKDRGADFPSSINVYSNLIYKYPAWDNDGLDQNVNYAESIGSDFRLFENEYNYGTDPFNEKVDDAVAKFDIWLRKEIDRGRS